MLDFSSDYDVNFMDDVGQTLLNWASAFGTLPMVRIDVIPRVSRAVITICLGEFWT